MTVLVWAECVVLWRLDKEEEFFSERLCSFGCWEDCHNSFLLSFLVSYSEARKETCGLRQCQTPL